MDSNMAAACEVLGVVDELLMNLSTFMLMIPLVLSMAALTNFRKDFPKMMVVC
jgi:ABC-type dipeptide/oligopeptide/nickel transport system permease subunit